MVLKNKMSKSKRIVHSDEQGLYVVYSGNVYRPYRPTRHGIGKAVKVTPTKALKSAIVNGELWRLSEESVLWRSGGIVR